MRIGIVLHIALFFVGFSFTGNLWSQQYNFKSINTQFQLDNYSGSTTDIGVLIVDSVNDTIWYEQHLAVNVSAENVFTLPIGLGTYISGIYSDFAEIDWKLVDAIEVINITGSPYVIGEFQNFSHPYAFHSLHTEYVPSTAELLDVTISGLTSQAVLKYDGTGFVNGVDLVADTVVFTWQSLQTNYSDTAAVVIYNTPLVDTVQFADYTDSANYAFTTSTAFNSDSTSITDTANYVLSTPNNWNINGNSGLTPFHFAGTTTDTSFAFGTNNTQRLIFDGNTVKNGVFPSNSFHISGYQGVTHIMQNAIQNQVVQDAYFYMNGGRRSLAMGYRDGTTNLDTTQALYSFHFGKNVTSNGTYSTVFGNQSFGDTTGNGTDPSSVFIAGRYCKAAPYGVAMGDSCTASFYRNVAIGKNVYASDASSAIGIGTNVISTGATSWAAGYNISANGPFSTAIGTNASSDGYWGCFIYGDASTSDTVFNTTNHQFMVRAAGGVIFYSDTNLLTGVQVSAGGGAWTMISDRNLKNNITPVGYKNFESSINQLSIYRWNYIGTPLMHYGPMAQDLYALFGVGESSRYISMVDADGIILAGIILVNKRFDNIEDDLQEQEVIEEKINNESKENQKLFERIESIYEKLDN
ncbi:MAG: tail fiber domain-containing protein [Crocinitomicaceae bacterium]|nr:tail fiber domain-containing protein [Crocinitomicaceae bacterium]